MPATQQQLEDFHRFAIEKVSQRDADLSLDELWGLWRIQNTTPEEHADNIAAIGAAIRDMENGDRGLPLDEHLRQLREKYSLPHDA